MKEGLPRPTAIPSPSIRLQIPSHLPAAAPPFKLDSRGCMYKKPFISSRPPARYWAGEDRKKARGGVGAPKRAQRKSKIKQKQKKGAKRFLVLQQVSKIDPTKEDKTGFLSSSFDSPLFHGLVYFLLISCPSMIPAFFCSVPKYRVMRKAHGMNMPTTMARVAVPLSAKSSVGSCATTLLGSAAKEASGEPTAAAVARAAAGKPDFALICTADFIATTFFVKRWGWWRERASTAMHRGGGLG